jgi:hypothetical protein
MTSPRTEAEERVTRVVEWVAAVAGPLTAVTAVLYYFGWTRTNAVFGYFGVDPAILNFDAADYLARAAGPAFAPAVGMLVGAAAVLALGRVGLWLELFCLRHPVTVRGWTGVVRPSIALAYGGAVALWCSARVAFGLPDYLGIGVSLGLTEPIPAALALAGGALVFGLGVRLLFVRPEPAPARLPTAPLLARLLLVGVVLVAVFWATSVYSQRVGEGLARFIDEHPASQPEVTVYSEDSLRLWSSTPIAPSAPESERFRHTYTGLRLLIYANDRWLLLTGERGPNGRLTVAILRDDEHIRVRLSG